MASCIDCKKLFTIAKEMNMTNFIANSLAFSPPKHVNYTIEDVDHIKSLDRGSCYKKVKFVHKEYTSMPYSWVDTEAYQLKKCSNKKRIILLRVINKNVPQNKKFTIVFSHGNSSDLSSIYSYLIDMATLLKVDVISYDYSGYGRSEGRASENEVCLDIEQVMDFLTNSLMIRQQSIVLMGYSLGSVPTIHMSVSKKFTKLSGVILIAPIASGMKLFDPNNTISTVDLEKVDVFCNLSKAADIDMPVLLIHGKKDTVIPIQQSEELFKKLKNAETWFPSLCDHNNIFSKCRDKFFIRVKNFLQQIFYVINKNLNGHDLLSENENSRISLIKARKNFKCEENYISSNKNIKEEYINDPNEFQDIQIPRVSHIKNEEEYDSNLIDSSKNPTLNCVSMNKNNIFEVPQSSENLFATKSIENEGDIIFASSNRISEYYYNYKDAKELEQQFNQIQKKVDN